MYQVSIGSEVREIEEGTPYLQIAQEYQKDYDNDIVLVIVNGKLQELHKTVKGDCKLEFETTAGEIGHQTYRRSMCLMMVKAVYDVAHHENIKKVRIHYSVSQGYYCTIEGGITLTKEFLGKVEARMHEMVEMRLPVQKKTVNTDDAIASFRQHTWSAWHV